MVIAAVVADAPGIACCCKLLLLRLVGLPFCWAADFSTLVDYQAGRFIHASKSQFAKSVGLLVSLLTNLGLLAFFKYSGFMAESLNVVADWLRMGGALPVPELILPVGISFYTFQTLSYTIDIYRGESKPANSFLAFRCLRFVVSTARCWTNRALSRLGVPIAEYPSPD